ncbi:MAG: ComF family protein [Christensenella sp.]|nr:ComF family protein [Christensenella sp.]
MKSRWRELIGSLTLTGAQCACCGREIPEGQLCCAQCESEENALLNRDGFCGGGVLYAYRYSGAVRGLLRRFKYGDMPRYAVLIAQKMADFLQDYEVHADLVTFVPIHPERKQMRGYDQAELIAGNLAMLLGLPFVPLLVREKNTKPQYRFNSAERAENIRGAFALVENAEIKGKNVLLIDDIYTTGATMAEALKPLAAAGASVMAYAYAREFPGEEK